MAKIKMRFPGSTEVVDVDERDLIQAMAKGAEQVDRYAIDKTLELPSDIKKEKV